jgi:endothelin-converting enzyme
MVNQYSAYTIPNPPNPTIHLNGQNTLNENIADNGGLKYAFRAWLEAFNSDPQGITRKNFKLPGLEQYTSEQLFFVSYGRGWCEKRTMARLVSQVEGDEHSPARWRVLGTMQNSEDFARAFNCKVGSPMNPVKKCSLW